MKAESYQSGRVASDGYVRELAGELLPRADKARERKGKRECSLCRT